MTDNNKLEKGYPHSCKNCGSTFSRRAKQLGVLNQVIQVFDLSGPKLEATEYQQYICQCSTCKHSTKEVLPEYARAHVQYGHDVRALRCLLNNAYHLSFKSIQSLIEDLFGYALNESTIYSNNIRLYDLLENSEYNIKQSLLSEAIGYSDEIGIRINNKLH